uniref:N-acetyltransferase domain-containing protein n=1 Tax=Ditylum brightwellii TaxID=49249 RepID=A0A7S4QFC4_9STRA
MVAVFCSFRFFSVLSTLVLNHLIEKTAAYIINSPISRRNHVSKSYLESFKKDDNIDKDDVALTQLTFRPPTAEEIPSCFAIESSSYPADEAASLQSLQYRQANALPYFQCAISNEDEIIGFVCSTRCHEFEEESMTTHHPDGAFLAIHSVVVSHPYRRKGFASTMLKYYVKHIEEEQSSIQSIVLLAKAHLLSFYVNCGFTVNRPSPIVHGQELWYELERKLVRTLPLPTESWFCKTETFKKSYPEVKPHLDAHKDWVKHLRAKGHCITSGYRVDSQGKPGGGGLMFLSAKSYEDALDVVLQDPLVQNDCVDWELNGWIGQVGDIQMR